MRLNGLTLWGRGSFSFLYEQFRLASLRYINAISVENGYIALAEARVPKELVDQAKDSINFLNKYLEDSDTQIRTISDLERLLAKAEKRALTKRLEHLESMQNIVQGGNAGASEAGDDQNDSLSQTLSLNTFIVDTDSAKLFTSNSQSHGEKKSSNGQSEKRNATDTKERTPNSESSLTRVTAKLSIDKPNLSGERGLLSAGNFEYVSGQTEVLDDKFPLRNTSFTGILRSNQRHLGSQISSLNSRRPTSLRG